MKIPPVIVVSLEFESIPIGDVNGEETVNACRNISVSKAFAIKFLQ